MWIRKIELRNFRSFGNSRQTLNARPGLNVVVGENNSGKSSVFAAVSHLLAFRNPAESDAPWGSSIAEMELAVDVVWQTFGDQVRTAILGRFDAQDEWLSKEDRRVFGESARLEWSRRTGYHVLLGEFDTNEPGKSGDRQAFAQVADELKRRHDKPLDRAMKEHPAPINFGSNVPEIVSKALRDRTRMFSDVRIRPQVARATPTAESWDGGNTAALLLTLKNGDAGQRRKYAKIQERFASLFPEFSFEVALPDGQNTRLVMLRKGYDFDIPAEQSGTGILEVLTIIANLAERERSVLVIEEPGTHLHPQAQRAIQRVIVESSKQNQVFVLTHSPEFVNWADLGGLARVWVDGVESRISQVDETTLKDNDKAVLVESLRDPRRREVLFARAVGLVEGETEEVYFEALAPRLGIELDALGISIVAVGSESAYRPYLRYLKALAIPCRCQRDKAPTGVGDEFKPLFTYTDSEFEDYMAACGHAALLKKAEATVGRSKARIGRYCGEHIGTKDVPPKHLEFLDALRKLLVK